MAATTADWVRLFQPANSQHVEQAAIEVLRSGQIASGSHVATFESALGEFLGRGHMVAINDMTNALVLALHLAGVGPGDEVLTLAFSCLSSNSAVARVGGTPVWVDIDPATASMSVEDLARALTPRTRAVMVYHVAGHPACMDKIAAFCREHELVLIEDCNNALGATLDGRPVGHWGDFAVYSFYPNRQINAIEGGAIACPDATVAARARRLRRFGIEASTFRDHLGEIDARADIPEIGWSASFGNLNAAVGLAQLPELAERLRRTRANADRLREVCGLAAWLTPVMANPGAQPCHWGFLVLAHQRDEHLARLKAASIQASRLHHRNDDYTGFHAQRRPLPGTNDFMARVLALPCGWWLTPSDMDRLTEAVLGG